MQAFKRMQYQGKRSVWSDVLVGQGPLFAVDRAVRLPAPLAPLPSRSPFPLHTSCRGGMSSAPG